MFLARAFFAAMYFSLRVSYALTLALASAASGFLVRTCIIFHDCTYGSFVATKRANTWLGTALGLRLTVGPTPHGGVIASVAWTAADGALVITAFSRDALVAHRHGMGPRPSPSAPPHSASELDRLLAAP